MSWNKSSDYNNMHGATIKKILFIYYTISRWTSNMFYVKGHAAVRPTETSLNTWQRGNISRVTQWCNSRDTRGNITPTQYFCATQYKVEYFEVKSPLLSAFRIRTSDLLALPPYQSVSIIELENILNRVLHIVFFPITCHIHRPFSRKLVGFRWRTHLHRHLV
jgi:hypothetical protein